MTTDISLSVLMPVTGHEPDIKAAVRSILDQSFGHFELILLFSGPSATIAESLGPELLDDERLRLSEGTAGPLSALLNRGLGAARGAVVALMDGQTRARADRLQRQWDFLQA